MPNTLITRIALDYFWPLAALWASFGALLTTLVLRKLDISRVSYREARQLLSAMVTSLSARTLQNEKLMRQLSEQLQVLKVDQARLRVEGPTVDRDRLVGYMQDWIGNMKGFVEKLDEVQNNLKLMEERFQELHLRVNRLGESGLEAGNHVFPIGVVTEDSLSNLSQTERAVLELLASGPKAAPQIRPVVGKSREHTSRLMKALFEQGFVEREKHRQPYEYRLNGKVKEALARNAPQQATPCEG